LLTPIAVIELMCIALYLVPRTAVLGAILVTGYLGGAIVTHLRVQDFGSAAAPLFLAIFAWGGLFLRDARLRDLLPLRNDAQV
ncbi:MAG TPA: DoxX family protein, partial [Polyangia bacterium]|nr:DoxX family protein [Polyangia bacterium]